MNSVATTLEATSTFSLFFFAETQHRVNNHQVNELRERQCAHCEHVHVIGKGNTTKNNGVVQQQSLDKMANKFISDKEDSSFEFTLQRLY